GTAPARSDASNPRPRRILVFITAKYSGVVIWKLKRPSRDTESTPGTVRLAVLVLNGRLLMRVADSAPGIDFAASRSRRRTATDAVLSIAKPRRLRCASMTLVAS